MVVGGTYASVSLTRSTISYEGMNKHGSCNGKSERAEA
jgi:hypothetical protein